MLHKPAIRWISWKVLYMKKTIIASIVAVISMLFAVPAMAGDAKAPPLNSAFSNVAPNNQKKVEVVERVNLNMTSTATSPQKMTVEQLVSDRPTIQYADMRGGSKLCTTNGSTCVSAEKHPATIKVATFVNGIGEPQNLRPVSRKSFDERKMLVKVRGGVIRLDCQVVDGRNTGNCRPASGI